MPTRAQTRSNDMCLPSVFSSSGAEVYEDFISIRSCEALAMERHNCYASNTTPMVTFFSAYVVFTCFNLIKLTWKTIYLTDLFPGHGIYHKLIRVLRYLRIRKDRL